MHELSIACNVVELVAEAAAGRRVRRVTLEIGQLSGVSPDALAFCFPEAAKGTDAEDAALEIREIEGAARCEACGEEFATPDLLTVCSCGSFRFQRVRGDELNVKSIEIEEPA
ncbi:MAG: hydrogenase maturation nickel metallochaperone HypA [Hyphomicrobiales bacterium]|nr:hydrogenase maturation nickel metallochaperone HypA [Hyphomicrobiales bacterium]